MSSSIPDKRHFDAVVAAAFCGPGASRTLPFSWLTPDGDWRSTADASPDEVGDMLVRACVLAVCERYPGNSYLPGPTEPYYMNPFRFAAGTLTPTAIEAIKLVRCVAYQASDAASWPESEARAFCEALIAHLIPEIDGYEEAPWSLDD